MSNTQYYFLPSIRQGLAAAIKPSPNGAHRAQLDVTLRAAARVKGTMEMESDKSDISMDVQLYGPGDIVGFDPRIILRTDPKPDVGDFEPNYFPAIEFADADFAWRFTAEKADGQTGRLMPWITLIVLVSEAQGDNMQPEFDEGSRSDQNLPPYIEVNTSMLPDLQHAWRWAHVHITGEENLSKDLLSELLRTEPERAVCRLLCTRRLAPKTHYTAFVVPTFELGILAGHGCELDPAIGALKPAWGAGDTTSNCIIYDDQGRLRLPYYYRWDFQTSVRGDFEHLVRLLEPRKLSGLGIRDIECEKPGFGTRGVNREGVDDPENHYLSMEGALKSVDTEYTQWGRDDVPAQPPRPLQKDITNLINGLFCPFDIEETDAINNIAVSPFVGWTSVQIAWHTPIKSTSHVDYGETIDYGHSKDDPDLKYDHLLTLTGLTSGTTYHFKIVVQAEEGTVAETGDGWFCMLPSVVPPIYGRWHAAQDRVNPQDQEAWLDVLNLDPRHRAAAGLGSQVIRKQQEPLMASAWEQLGAIESANDILRRAQFGRDSSIWLYQRLDHLATEDFFRVTSPVHKRVIVEKAERGEKMTAAQYLKTQSRIPAAALDPAFRRIMRPRGPIRKRQGAGRSVNLLSRLALGEPVAVEEPLSKPLGTTRLCDTTRQLLDNLPAVTISANPAKVKVGETSILSWSAGNCTSCRASGGPWQGAKICTGDEEVGPFDEPGEYTFHLMCEGLGGSVTASTTIEVEEEVPAPAVSLSANPAKVKEGKSSILHWSADNCTSCRATGGPWHGAKICTGDEEVGPFDEPGVYTFYLMCEGPGGSVTASTTIEVEEEVPAPTVSLTADPEEVKVGKTLTLYWRASNCTSCRATGGPWQGAKICTGDEEVGPFDEPGEYTFYLMCVGPGGSVTASTKIRVEEEVPPPTVSLTADPEEVKVGESSILSWSAGNCTSCRASGGLWQGAKICTGDEEVGPFYEPGEYTFHLRCEGLGGSVTASTTIWVEEVPAPTVSLSANPTIVKVGKSSILHWSAGNCTSCRASGGPWQGAKICTGDEEVGPFDEPGEYTFHLRCEGPGGSVTASTKIRVEEVPAPTVSLTADPAAVKVGETLTLHWRASNCTSCRASGSRPWQGTKICTGDEEVGPFEVPGEYTFYLTCEGPGGSFTVSITIFVMSVPAPTVSLTADPAAVKVDETSTLHWQASNCTSCMASGSRHWQGAKICTGGDEEVGPFEVPGEYTLHLTGEGPGGRVTASTKIRVELALAPDVDITVDPPEVNVGVAVTLHWHASNCTSCMASGSRHWQGAKICTGDEEVGPFEVPGEYTLHLTGEGPGGSVTASITILVMGVRAPTVSIFAWSDPLSPYFVFLKWSASNCTSCIDPFGGTICEGGRQAGVSLGENTFCIKCTAPEEVEKCVTITVRDDGSVVSVTRTLAGDRRVEDDPALRFCDGYITCQRILDELQNHQPFADIEDIPDPQTTAPLICRTLDDWLDKQPEGGIPEPPTQDPDFVDKVKEMVFPTLDPNRTVVERTKKRLRLAGELAERFEEGAEGDPLGSIMWAPQFPQPMYEPLLEISHDLLLPGVDKIPQNTISLLQTNRRFLESYMCGSNHEFAGELLWRGYPTDQRGSYFRQFWDVSEYVPRQQELERLLIEWLAEQEPRTGRPITSVEDLPLVERRRILRRHLDRVLDELLNKWLAEANVASVDDLQDELKRRVIKRLQDEQVEAVSEIPEEDVNDLVTKLIMEEQLKEKLKDITHLISWRSNPLGSNRDQPGERLVLVVRGDLLKRYPNAMIYAIDAVPCDCADGDPVPGLREYLKCYKQDANGNTIVDEATVSETLNDVHRIFPVFQATLPPDLTFFGFPFSEEDARGFGGGRGKYFVIEEQVLEPRFGLDVTTDELLSWDDLSWTHFGLQEAFGSYLDENTIEKQPEDNSGKEWNDADTPGKPASSSATRAWITLQKPVRIAMHAKQMLPESAYFEFTGPDPEDRFVIKLVDPEKIEHARKILRGAETGRTHIAGVIALEKASYNHPDWSYHMKPDSIEFFDEAKEVCDATMRYVEEHLDEVGGAFLPGNRWCPWGSELTSELKNIGE